MNKLLSKLLLLMAVVIGNAHANGGFISIGAGVDCNVNTLQGGDLQTTLNITPAEIRLVNNVTYTGQFITSGGVIIRGGYDSCADAANDLQGSALSVLDGDFQGTTLTLDANGAYTLEQVAIINGSNPSDRGGGLLLKAQDMTVMLDRVTVENNEAQWGGGIFKGSNLNVQLVIKDSVIKDNLAAFNTGLGGGIFYDLGGELIVYGDTEITENQAIAGGGIYMTQAQATFIGGANASINSGISLNKATAFGGGMYARNSTVVISGGIKNIPGIGEVGEVGKNFNVIFNESDSDQNNNGDAGGLYFDFFSTVELEAVTIALNKSHALTGGMMVNNGSVVKVGRPENGGCQVTNLMGCNFIVENTSDTLAGGIFATNQSKVTLESVNFSKNRANNITAISANGTNTEVTVNSSIFYENGDSGMGGFFDQYVMQVSNGAKLKVTQSTAVKNRATLGFISNSNGRLESYYNYFYNDQTGPWLVSNGTVVEDYQCLVVDNTHNVTDLSRYIRAGADSMNSNHFVDAANQDFHIPDNGFFQDYVGSSFCPVTTFIDLSLKDIDGEPRTNFTDLGADENLSNDFIFVDDFE